MVAARVQITGLRETRAAFRLMGGTINDDLRVMLKEAADIVVMDARSQVPSRSGKAAASIRSVAGGNTIWVKGGGAAVPYYGWLEFGGTLPGKRPRSRKALMWSGAEHPSMFARGGKRAKMEDGRYIYPALKRNEPAVEEAAALAVDIAKRKAGL